MTESKAKLEKILNGEEVKELKAISEGLKGLVEWNDFVFLDTSFLVNRIANIFNYGKQWIEKYKSPRVNGRSRIDFESIEAVYKAFVEGSNPKINLQNLQGCLDENLLVSDLGVLSLQELISLGNILISERVYQEAENIYTKRGKAIIDLERKDRNILRNLNGDPQTTIRSQSVMFYREDFVENYKKALNNLGELLRLFRSERLVVENGNSYPSDDRNGEYADYVIIDTAMERQGHVGIITHDKDFRKKIAQVGALRKRLGKDTPASTSLIIAPDDLKDYRELTFMDYEFESFNRTSLS
ncbi:MAG: hypothetical protein CMH64_04105 [Nanoarchaeota archaeon]|nr:hypothetical protein [Nanoarchaeota archaeon]|tara:strand:- start:1301 stop:2197 length:897 start_codon:yes stop_codon:yes gene_type:complete